MITSMKDGKRWHIVKDRMEYTLSEDCPHWHLKSVKGDVVTGIQCIECWPSKEEAERNGFKFARQWDWSTSPVILDGVYSGLDGMADAVSALVSATVDGLQRHGKTYRVVVTEVTR
jgi:hypothetical protein